MPRVEDLLGDIRREIAEAQEPREIGPADPFPPGECGKGSAFALGEWRVEPARPEEQPDQSRVGFRGKRIGAVDHHSDLSPGTAQPHRYGQKLNFVVVHALRWIRTPFLRHLSRRVVRVEIGQKPGVVRGTGSSNPSPSSRQSVSLPQSFSEVENPAFRASLGCWLGDRVGRDARVFRYRTNWRQYLCRPNSSTAVRLMWWRDCHAGPNEVGPSLTYGRSLNSDWAQAKPSTIR